MTVKIVLYGYLREALGFSEQVITLDAKSTVEDLIGKLRSQCHIRPTDYWDYISIAINDEYTVRTRVLSEHDRIALLPPVSGGC